MKGTYACWSKFMGMEIIQRKGRKLFRGMGRIEKSVYIYYF